MEFKNATADQLEYGELALNYNESGPYLQCKGSNEEVVQLGGVYISASAPLNPIPGKWWLNGDTLNVYDGSKWISIAGDGSGGGGDPVYNGELTIEDQDGNVLGTFTANQDSDTIITVPLNDFSGSWNDLTDKPTIGDGRITIEENDGNDVGEFTVNQVGDLIITLPPGASFSGSYDDLANKPAIGDGKLTVKRADGTIAGEFTANQIGNSEVNLPEGFSGDYGDLANKPVIGDGTIIFKDTDGTNVGSFSVNQESNTEIILPDAVIPDSLHPKGFINVDDPAPANPEHGDIYIQHKNDLSDGVADASFDPGIPTGTTVEEGTFVMFGVDDLWHAGGNANSTQVQADWAETNSTEPSFIQNKPTIGDAKITILDHLNVSVGSFTTNQETNQELALPAYMPLDLHKLTPLI